MVSEVVAVTYRLSNPSRETESTSSDLRSRYAGPIVHRFGWTGKRLRKNGCERFSHGGPSRQERSGAPGMVHYTPAKHDVLSLTRALAVEYYVQLNCIYPVGTTIAMILGATTCEFREPENEKAFGMPNAA